MRDRVWILLGLGLFAALLTMPFWHAAVSPKAAQQGPAVALPANPRQCVAPAATMRAEHMHMLIAWREDVVRNGNRRFMAFNGKTYEKSLTGTCLGCHNKAEFCDRCHAYSGVSTPYCWSCHNELRTTVAGSMR